MTTGRWLFLALGSLALSLVVIFTTAEPNPGGPIWDVFTAVFLAAGVILMCMAFAGCVALVAWVIRRPFDRAEYMNVTTVVFIVLAVVWVLGKAVSV